jgi:hypothetical protein
VRLRLAAAFSLVAAALAGPLVAPAQVAAAATGDIVAPSQIGYDVSFPQCTEQNGTRGPDLKQPLPVEPAFGIVGVNGGLGNTNNACFAAQLQWALGSTAVTSQPRVGLYVNAQNPGHEGKWWPDSDATQVGTPVDNPFGACADDDGPACAYVYGYSMAEADATPAVRHVLLPAAYTWWLDVETSNTWSATNTTANRAVLEGMVAAFSDVDAHVGLYSTHLQWSQIVGHVPASSPLAELPSWLSAAVTQRGAAENCTHAPLTGGRVALAQWSDGALDYNISCRQFSVARTPTVAGAARVGSRLSAHAGVWAPGGITLAYRWLRNGHAISGATRTTYTLQRADAGARISVRVTGTKLAYNAASRTSRAVHVSPVITAPRPTVTGTARKAATLTAHAGRWAPAPVSVAYRWLRDGVAIAGATGSHHVVTGKDLGHRISVAVTGTKRGYAAARRTSAARSIPRTIAAAAAPPAVQPSSVVPSLRTPPATVTPSPSPATGPAGPAASPTPAAESAGPVAPLVPAVTTSPAVAAPIGPTPLQLPPPSIAVTEPPRSGAGILAAHLRAH